MQSARHLAAAARGGEARVSEANSISNIGKGAVTKRRRCETIVGAISGKLEAQTISTKERYAMMNFAHFCTMMIVDFSAASCTRPSEIGDSTLRRSFRRVKRASSSSCSAIEHTEANFCNDDNNDKNGIRDVSVAMKGNVPSFRTSSPRHMCPQPAPDPSPQFVSKAR